jgi:hypothetical protein
VTVDMARQLGVTRTGDVVGELRMHVVIVVT